MRQSWYKALDHAQSQFRHLLSSNTTEWKRVIDATTTTKGKAKAIQEPELSNVNLYRKATKSGDIYRVSLEVLAEEPVALEPWKAVLATPELRKQWDPAVESAHLLELLDPDTRISKTNFTLGWPAK